MTQRLTLLKQFELKYELKLTWFYKKRFAITSRKSFLFIFDYLAPAACFLWISLIGKWSFKIKLSGDKPAFCFLPVLQNNQTIPTDRITPRT